MGNFNYADHGRFAESKNGPLIARASRVWFVFALIGLYAVMTSGTSPQSSHGVCYAAAGFLMLVRPPEVRVSPVFYGLGFALVAFPSLCFLPAQWFSLSCWRIQLEATGLNTGRLVTPHPESTLEHLVGMAVTVFVALYLLGHRTSTRCRSHLALLFCLGVAFYTIVSIILYTLPGRQVWDPAESFGIFPNRNHTATFLSMGALCGMGTLLQMIRYKEAGMSVLVGLSTIVCLCGVMGFSSSRAGVLLTCGGTAAWIAFLGSNYTLKTTGAILILLIAATVAGFLFAETTVKSRFAESLNRISKLTLHASEEGLDGSSSTPGLGMLDLRIPIMRETLTMLRMEPWCGTGLGTFRFVFPQYQAVSSGLMNSSSVIHPESDWLWLTAEAGPGAAASLVTALILAAYKVLKGARSENGWALRLACIIAAFIVPFHGLFDVPGHRLGLAWWSIILITMSIRRVSEPRAGRGSRLFFRLAGLASFLSGVYLLTGIWFKTPLPSSMEPLRLYAEAVTLYTADAAERNEFLAAAKPLPVYAEDHDKLSEGLNRLDAAIKMTPLDPSLHYFQGALALHFDDKDDFTDAAFTRQRLLEPLRINVPLRQAAGWAAIDPIRTDKLWQEALARAHYLEPCLAQASLFSVNNTFKAIMEQVHSRPELGGLSLKIANESRDFLKIWVMAASKKVIESHMTDLLSNERSPAVRSELLELLAKRGIKKKGV